MLRQHLLAVEQRLQVVRCCYASCNLLLLSLLVVIVGSNLPHITEYISIGSTKGEIALEVCEHYYCYCNCNTKGSSLIFYHSIATAEPTSANLNVSKQKNEKGEGEKVGNIVVPDLATVSQSLSSEGIMILILCLAH